MSVATPPSALPPAVPRSRRGLLAVGVLALAGVLIALGRESGGEAVPPASDGASLVASPAADRAAALAEAHGQAPQVDAPGHAATQREREVRERFEQAVVMLHAKQYEHALAALHRVIELAPRLPEAHVNLGYAHLGLHQHDEARAAFQQAIDLRPEQANAYYGLALAAEALGDRPVARGAMRSYLHLSPADAPHRSKARAALWEWEEAGGAAVAASAPVPSVVRLPGR